MRKDRIWNILWVIIGIIAVSVSIAVIFRSIIGPRYYPNGGYYGMMGGYYGFGWFGMIIFGVAALIITVLLVYFVVEVLSSTSDRSSSEAARRMVMERYAKGEITREEYEEMMRHFDEYN